jgi:D-alanyl-lipoteichoic acid acyltransferase DltB (MBOAT superfamily)
MSSNSIEFVLFFGVVFFLYYVPLKEKTGAQNILLLLGSGFFYGLADWKMIPLLVLVSLSFYALGIGIGKSREDAPRRAAVLTALGVGLGVGLLLYCKYLNFFIGSFNRVFSALGLHANWGTFTILVPLGISFFTFKLISYVLEVYRGRMEPVRDIPAFGVYTFFSPLSSQGRLTGPTPLYSKCNRNVPLIILWQWMGAGRFCGECLRRW